MRRVGWHISLFVIATGFIVAVFFATLLWAWYTPHTRWNASGLIVQPGTSDQQLIRDIAQHNDMLPYWLVDASLHLMSDQHKVHYGEYRLEQGLSLAQLLHNIDHKKGLVRHKITFIEGWTFLQLKQALMKDGNLKHRIVNKSNKQIMEALDDAKQHPEGQFFPDTYQFVWGNSAISILRQSHQQMTQVLQQEWDQRAPNLSYKTAYEALIVASLIEVEASAKTERPLVAGVILQRLKIGMRLQIDPTVLYGLDKPYGMPLTKHDLATITPYNTYRVEGLPPTPIDMPSQSSIHAALHPVFKGYLYYVSRGDGTHLFSASYDEHRKGVADYRKKQRIKQEQQEQVMSPWPISFVGNWWLRPLRFILMG